jgi:hypothetical protein
MDDYGSTRSGVTGGALGDPLAEPEGGLPPEAAPILATSAAAALGAKARQHPWTLTSLLLAVLTLGLVLVLRRRGGDDATALVEADVPPIRLEPQGAPVP